MIGLILLYHAGKAFYNLAGEHGKSQWGFAILGVVSYYAGLFLGAIAIGIVYEVVLSKSLDDMNDTVLSLLGIPIGVLCCWGLYKFLEYRWSNTTAPDAAAEDNVLDAGLLDKTGES